jgi:glycosyltransferase involved in cell wall biosynthesis
MEMNAQPLVSIITPVYNGAEYLDELIQSVLRQDYPNIEHLIIDDGSQDDGATVSVLKKYPHLRWWSRENFGQYATMNEGLDAARGNIICFVSADDIVATSAVSLVFEFLESHPNHDGVFGITSFIDKNGEPLPNLLPFRHAPMFFIPYFAHVSHCSLYIKRQSLLHHQLDFDPSLKFVGDYEWMIRINKSKLKIGIFDNILSKVRLHDSQISHIFDKESSLEAKLVLKKHKVNKFYHFILWGGYLLIARIKKIITLYKNSGIKEVISRIKKYYLGK